MPGRLGVREGKRDRAHTRQRLLTWYLLLAGWALRGEVTMLLLGPMVVGKIRPTPWGSRNSSITVAGIRRSQRFREQGKVAGWNPPLLIPQQGPGCLSFPHSEREAELLVVACALVD